MRQRHLALPGMRDTSGSLSLDSLFHLEEYTSAQHLLQVLEEEDFARRFIAPEEGIKKSSFAEAINSRGLEQLAHI